MEKPGAPLSPVILDPLYPGTLGASFLPGVRLGGSRKCRSSSQLCQLPLIDAVLGPKLAQSELAKARRGNACGDGIWVQPRGGDPISRWIKPGEAHRAREAVESDDGTGRRSVSANEEMFRLQVELSIPSRSGRYLGRQWSSCSCRRSDSRAGRLTVDEALRRVGRATMSSGLRSVEDCSEE